MNNLPAGISAGFWILWAAVLLALLVLYFRLVRRNLSNRRAPMRSEWARLESLQPGKSPLSPQRGTFRSREGETRTLYIDAQKARDLSEGSEGLLFYKGNTFVSLDRHRHEV